MIPKNSPRAFHNALCSECGETMRPVLKRQANGVLTSIDFACDHCKYQVEASLPYINCSPSKYEAPPPEPVEVKPALMPSPEQLSKMKESLTGGTAKEPPANPNPQPIQVVSTGQQLSGAPEATSDTTDTTDTEPATE